MVEIRAVMKYTLRMGKKGFTILIITVIYLCATGASLLPLFGGNRISDASVRNRKANVEYMSVHMSGGLSVINETIEVFIEGDKYYLVSTNDDSVKHELTKFEYLLCTDIDFDFLREQDGVIGSDLIYEHVEYRPVGGDTVSLPTKDYWYFPGMIYFFNRILTTPDYEITRADELAIELGKYAYLQGSPDIIYRSSQNLGDNVYGTYLDFYYGNGDTKQQYDFWQKCKDGIDSDAGAIVNRLVNRNYSREEQNKILEESMYIPSGSGNVYYHIEANEDIVLVEMMDLDTYTFFLTYADKSRQQDILSIMTGKETGHAWTVIALAIETVVFVGAVGAVIVISKRKNSNAITLQ